MSEPVKITLFHRSRERPEGSELGWLGGVMSDALLVTVLVVIVAGVWVFVDQSTRRTVAGGGDTQGGHVGALPLLDTDRHNRGNHGTRYRVRFGDYDAWLPASELTEESRGH